MKYIIQPFLNKYGGAERKTYLFAQECKKNKIRFKIITYKLDESIYKEYKLREMIIVIKSPNLFIWIIRSIIFILKNRSVSDIFAMNYPANIVAGL